MFEFNKILGFRTLNKYDFFSALIFESKRQKFSTVISIKVCFFFSCMRSVDGCLVITWELSMSKCVTFLLKKVWQLIMNLKPNNSIHFIKKKETPWDASELRPYTIIHLILMLIFFFIFFFIWKLFFD